MASFTKRSDYHAACLVRCRSLDSMACADNPLPCRAAFVRGRVHGVAQAVAYRSRTTTAPADLAERVRAFAAGPGETVTSVIAAALTDYLATA
jgi:hypothetical protein